MATFEDIIQEVLLNVEGYLGEQDVYGTVSSAGGAGTFWDATGTTTGTVAGGVFPDGSGFQAGIIEVSDELIYATAFDRATGIFTGCLRGWRGSTAVAHLAGEPVRSNPRYPRVAVKRAINDTLVNLYPQLPAVRTTEFSAVGGQMRYTMPTDARGVVSVRVDEPGSTGLWVESKQWRFDTEPGGESAGNRSIDIADAVPGRTARVVYYAEPTQLSGLTDVFDTTTGLEDFGREVVVHGATYRLIRSMALPKIAGTSAAQRLVNEVSPVSVASDLAQYHRELYEFALEKASKRLRGQYPARKHSTWW